MKLSTREDIEAPIAYVYERVSDFAAFERRALRQGAQVSCRTEGAPVVGTIWDIAFEFRGRSRKVQAELTKREAEQALEIESQSDGLIAVTQVDLVALSATRTRVLVSFDMKAKTLTARLLLQSLKLAKAKMTKRFKSRVLDYAESVEDDYRRGQ
ncbi:SRPBCC family protein [Yoonia sp. F2084L]|uniref:SRPBCC family protein n=1 Tax=Yoonia sp. F2084L TaxID=2926419 RepID=UPI001FF0E714|nr:SRPBCC family protein [Yoonia sp. F2084L]MCK0096588.1 SRPBCC family protein [Yoonia sp. F2084L]